MRINLLGPMEVLTDDGVPVEVGGAKQRAVLAQLACTPNVAVPLDLLAEGIWGTRVPPRYRQNLQVYVSTLRRALEPDRPGKAPSRIVGHREAYELVAADDEIDVRRFETGARAGREALDHGRPDAAATLLGAALAEWRGTPLVDLADQPFAGTWTSDLLEQQTTALEDRIAADLARGRSAELVAELGALVTRFPERERLWEQLMVALYRSGRQSEALDVFRRARDTLLDETGLDPGPTITEMADRILHQDPTLLASAPSTAESGTVPVPLTPVIGSPAAIPRALSLLDQQARLVVLTGPGGVGKTRLALAVAAELIAQGHDVVWVPLEEATSAEAASTAIAARLGVPDLHDPGADVAGRSAVLLLDNLEQIPDLARPLQAFLEAAPSLQLLATSRSPLGIRGEHLVEVPPLDTDTAAVALFAERARSTNPGFDLDGCRADVARICAALDGLPLAIELAGARTTLFTAAELAVELVGDPEVVDAADRGPAGGRQDTLHDLVGWSLDLLPDRTRHLMERLALCPGTFDLDTAVVVAALVGLSPDRARLAVADLVRGSLLRAVEDEAGRRFTMLNTIRAVAAAPLTSADRDEVATVVADWRVSRSGPVDGTGNADRATLARVRAGLPLTRWVLAHLVSAGRADDAARIVLADRRAHAQLGIADETFGNLLELLGSGALTPAWTARVRVAAGRCAYVCHDPRDLELLSAVDDLAEDDYVFRVTGHTATCASLADAGDDQGALLAATRGLAAADAARDPALRRLALSAAAWAALRRGAYADAAAYARAQLPLAESDADTSLALSDVALAELFLESTDTALEAATEALRLAWRQGEGTPITQAQQQVAYGLVQADDLEGALSMLVSCLRGCRDHHDTGFTIETTAALGLVAAMMGRSEEGRRLIRECNAVTLAEWGGELAVSEPLRTAAARHAIDIGHEAHRILPLTPVTDLLDEALALAEDLLMSGTPTSRRTRAVR